MQASQASEACSTQAGLNAKTLLLTIHPLRHSIHSLKPAVQQQFCALVACTRSEWHQLTGSNVVFACSVQGDPACLAGLTPSDLAPVVGCVPPVYGC